MDTKNGRRTLKFDNSVTLDIIDPKKDIEHDNFCFEISDLVSWTQNGHT